MFRYFILAAALLFTACAHAAESAPNFDGVWQNDRGSVVVFDVKDGLITGYYQTALGDPDKATRFPLTGFTEGDQITFTVNFKGYGSLTSWTGQMTEDTAGEYIRTLWNLTRDVEDAAEGDDLWSSIVSGASEFRRVGNSGPQSGP